MRKSTVQALSCWMAAMALLLTLLFAFLGAPGTPDGAGEAIGRGLAHTGLSALCVWLFARKKDWPWLRFVVAYVGAFLLLGVMSTIGQRGAANEREPWPFEASIPEGWTVEYLAGASSAAQDAALGVREIARKGTGVGAPVIQLACVTTEPGEDLVDLDKLAKQLAERLETQYASAHAQAKTVVSNTKVAEYPSRALITSISLDTDVVFQQESVVARTDSCIFSAQVAALPSEFDGAAQTFRNVMRSIQFRGSASHQ